MRTEGEGEWVNTRDECNAGGGLDVVVGIGGVSWIRSAANSASLDLGFVFAWLVVEEGWVREEADWEGVRGALAGVRRAEEGEGTTTF